MQVPKLTKKESEQELENLNCYVFTVNEDFDLDGSVKWNPARYLNHSCKPNCESDVKKDRVWIYSTKKIKKVAIAIAIYNNRKCPNVWVAKCPSVQVSGGPSVWVSGYLVRKPSSLDIRKSGNLAFWKPGNW